MTDRTVALLGDSILDNAPYTRPEPDTTAVLRERLAAGWTVVRLARDGATMSDMRFQLAELDGSPDHAVVSIGGNDATGHIGLLDRRATHAAEVLEELLGIADEFQRRYEATVAAVAERARHTVLCTIYEVPLEPPAVARLARVPLAVLNDRIVRTAARLGVDVLELRSVCTDPADFVRQIEPSPRGAGKIARAIADLLQDGGRLRSGRVFAAGA
ncbi:MAG TPA: SGNH/GDSL hydrolase family protein [Gemmatimonadales bacterium]|nr:SGNH/GDSL hydrolase family protein [Gemmatimonadales bacterium]